jgi:hypothetical protein
MRDAVFGNAGTMICFRIGVEDAEIMAKEFAPVFNEFDVINIERFNAYVKLMIKARPRGRLICKLSPSLPAQILKMPKLSAICRD